MKKYFLLVPGLVFLLIAACLAAITTSATATDGDEECTPQAAYTDTTGWVLESPGAGWYQVDARTVEESPAGTQTTGWLLSPPAGDGWTQVDSRKVIDTAATADTQVFDHWQRYSLTGGSWPEGPEPAFRDPGDPFRWVANVQGDPHGIGNAGAYDVSNEQSGNTDWFYLEAVMKTVPGSAEVSHMEYTYQRSTPAVTHQEFRFAFDHDEVTCPPDEEKNPKVVVCKYVGTPGGTLHHVVIVSESTLTHLEGYTPGDFPFSWTDAHGQTQEGSIAIRYATEGEQANDFDPATLAGICPQDEPEPEPDDASASVTVTAPTCESGAVLVYGAITNATFSGTADGTVGPGDYEVVATADTGHDFAGDTDTQTFSGALAGPLTGGVCVEGEQETACPDDSELNAGEVIPDGQTEEEFCNKDNPPRNPPTPGGKQETPPEVAGKQATAPSQAPAGAPAAVPTAVDAGL